MLFKVRQMKLLKLGLRTEMEILFLLGNIYTIKMVNTTVIFIYFKLQLHFIKNL